MVIIPESAVKAAARAVHARHCCPLDPASQCDENDLQLEDCRRALEAAMPVIYKQIAEAIDGKRRRYERASRTLGERYCNPERIAGYISGLASTAYAIRRGDLM